MKLYSFFNLGNTCYLNSVLQCFLNDDNFKKNLRVMDNNKQLIHLLNDIEIDLNDPGVKLFKHYNLIKMVEYFNKKFSHSINLVFTVNPQLLQIISSGAFVIFLEDFKT